MGKYRFIEEKTTIVSPTISVRFDTGSSPVAERTMLSSVRRQRIQTSRVMLRLTVDELALASGISVHDIIAVEQGKIEPSLQMLVALEAALNVALIEV